MEDNNQDIKSEVEEQNNMSMEEYLNDLNEEERLLAACPFTYPELYRR